MARQNVPLLSFNRGIISPKALARVDLDRTKLSAEVMTNWLPKSQGAMQLRPGTKYLGSSYNDTGAMWIEFVASTDDTALIELTHQKMRIWIDDALLSRPHVSTTVTLSDTGWSNTSTGGTVTTGSTVDVIPVMTGPTTSGVTISASHENTFDSIGGNNRSAWRAADNNGGSWWQDTGSDQATTVVPTTWTIDFGASNTQAVTSYSLTGRTSFTGQMPSAWAFQRSDDGSSWVTEDTQGSETSWAAGETKTYNIPSADTGTIEARRYWRFSITAVASTRIELPEIQMFTAASSSQVVVQSGQVILNAKSIGGIARREKRVIISDTGDYNVEHSLAISISRGPVTVRVGSTQGDDDYISETRLGTGYHNLAFTPSGNFWITLRSRGIVDRVVESLTIGDTGTVEITTHIDAEDLDSIRYDQSADVVYVDSSAEPHKIERRGTGRSWSWVEFLPNNGPFLPYPSSSAKLSPSGKYGNITITSDIPFFSPDHVAGASGALLRLFHGGQSGKWPLGALNAATDAIEVTGITDTGQGDTGAGERVIVVSITGTYTGTIKLERSFDGPESGFHDAALGAMSQNAASDTGTFSRTIFDPDDNVTVWYRARMSAYTSGTAIVTLTYNGSGTNGIARITEFNTNTSVEAEVLSRFSDTGSTDSWQEGAWSGNQSYPTAVALHEGRLSHAGGASIYMSVSDDYENYDIETEGDAAPIIKTLGSGPVDRANYLISLLRLIVGTDGAEIAVRSSSLDEPLTPTNSSAKPFSTQGSANIRPVRADNRAIFVQRSTQRVFSIGLSQNAAIGDYEAFELTNLVPDLLEAGVVSIAIQRQPDTRIHLVLSDGRVAILTYEPQEDKLVLCWSMWETDGVVERAMVLPGVNEDQVYYHVNRTINGATKRFLEKWAMESEATGDTGLSFIADCAVSYTDTGRATTIHGADHLIGETVVVWGDDTGNTYPSKDYSPDVAGVQTTYQVDTGGNVNLTGSNSVHHAVVGLPYTANWKSTKLAYAAQGGTALAQMKRTDKIGFVLADAHNNGLFFGNDTGHLDPLPRKADRGAVVDPRKVYETFDQIAIPFPGLWDTDSRICLKARAPRPVTVLAAVPTIITNEK